MAAEADEKSTDGRRYSKIAIFVGLGILVVQSAIGAVIYYASGTNLAAAGQFGDMFGAVNALFSGLAFAGLIFTILLQREELQLQRQELADTRHELQRTAAAQEASLLAFRAQADAANRSGRLATINFLIERYTVELERFRGRALAVDDPRALARQQLIQKIALLNQTLEEFYNDVIQHGGNR